MNRLPSGWMLKGLLSVALVAALTALTLFAQSTTQPATAPSATAPPPAPAHITPAAQAILDKIRDSYAKLTSLDLSGNLSVDFDGGGQQRHDHGPFTAVFRSPNKFRHDMKDQTTVVSNGQKLYTYLTRDNAYLTDDAPKSRADGLPGQVGALLMDQDPSLALVLAPNASDALLAGASDVSTGDQTIENGTPYLSLKLVHDDEDVNVLVDPSTNLLHSVQHDLRRSMQQQGVPNVKVALVTVDYLPAAPVASTQNAPQNVPQNATIDWTPPADAKPLAAPSTPAAGTPAPAGVTPPQSVSFDWTPPPGAKPLADPASAPGNADNPYAEVAARLEGKPAPPFTLKTPDGKAVSLADQKGSVVVLDFWASWCVPCRESLPHIDKVAKERAADGVKTFALDQPEEDASQALLFFKQAALSLPMLLDPDSTVGEKYLSADGSLPETVVIDKNGVVRKVICLPLAHDEEKTLNDLIDAALKGK